LSRWNGKRYIPKGDFIAERLHDSVNLYKSGGIPNYVLGKRSECFVVPMEITVWHFGTQIVNGILE
jgi:hypothetical protein